jgi:lysylphosphatidylglycerol synthetase-like protein (DUF2156 family)
MVSLVVIFWMYVIMFGIIGAMRGWAKELLVTFSVILALFFITVLEIFVPFIRDVLSFGSGAPLFWIRLGITAALVLFGYQTPSLPKLAASNRFVRERLQDVLLGIFIGMVNGYFVMGSIWYFLNAAAYPFPTVISTPTGELLTLVDKYMTVLPPALFGTPTIYFAVAIAFAFILMVFI